MKKKKAEKESLCPECRKRHSEKVEEKEPLCPECNTRHSDVRKDKNGNMLCDMVYGRRGWRQLGVYDG